MRIYTTFFVIFLFCTSCSFPSSRMDTTLREYPSDNSILTFHIDPWKEDSLLYSTINGIYKSNDEGKTWEYISKQPGKPPITTLVPHPLTEGNWLGYSTKTVYKTIDGGRTWVKSSKNLYQHEESSFSSCKTFFYRLFPSLQPKNIDLYDVVIPAFGSKKVFCATSNGLYFQQNNDPWTHIESITKYGEITSLVDLPNLELIVCLSKNSALFSIEYDTLDSVSLEKFSFGTVLDMKVIENNAFLMRSTVGIFQAEFAEHPFLSLTIHPIFIEENITSWTVHKNHIWIQTGENLLYSQNTGYDWETLNFPFPKEIIQIQYSSQNSQLYILTNSHGILFSKNGLDWITRVYSIKECHITSIQQDSVVFTTLFCSTKNQGVFCSLDRGITWFSISTGIEHTTIYSLLSIKIPYHALFAATQNNGLFIAYNQNYQWSQLNTVFVNMSITAMFPSRHDEQPMLVGVWDPLYEQSLLYYSFNGGLEWLPIIFPSKINTIQGFTKDSMMFWIGTNHGLYTWSAKSLSYEPTIFTNSITLLHNHPNNEEQLFIGTMSGLYETLDNGNHFHSVSCNRQYHLGSIDDILFFPRESHSIILVSGGHLYKTNDDGETWSRLSRPKDHFFTTLYTDISEPQTLFAGTKHNGILYSYNQGKDWYSASDFTKF